MMATTDVLLRMKGHWLINTPLCHRSELELLNPRQRNVMFFFLFYFKVTFTYENTKKLNSRLGYLTIRRMTFRRGMST